MVTNGGLGMATELIRHALAVVEPIANLAAQPFFNIPMLPAQRLVEPVLQRLDPPRRAAVVMALLGVVLTGLLLVAIAMLGAHWVRRQARHRPGSDRKIMASEAEQLDHKLRGTSRSFPQEQHSGDTIHADGKGRDTTTDI
jgi:hypothetical protein